MMIIKKINQINIHLHNSVYMIIFQIASGINKYSKKIETSKVSKKDKKMDLRAKFFYLLSTCIPIYLTYMINIL